MTKTKKWRTRIPRPIGHEFYDPFDYSVWRVTKPGAYVGVAEIEYDVEEVSKSEKKFTLGLPSGFSVRDPWHAPSTTAISAKCAPGKHDVIENGTRISECRVCQLRMEWTRDMTWGEAPDVAATGDADIGRSLQEAGIVRVNYTRELLKKMFPKKDVDADLGAIDALIYGSSGIAAKYLPGDPGDVQITPILPLDVDDDEDEPEEDE